jgi:hypothetical protein
MRFIEPSAFTSGLRRQLEDEEYRALQLSLVLRPDQGVLIPGGAGLRKLRWRAEGRAQARWATGHLILGAFRRGLPHDLPLREE